MGEDDAGTLATLKTHRKEQEGLALEVDRDKLTKKGKAEAIKAIEDVLSQLKG